MYWMAPYVTLMQEYCMRSITLICHCYSNISIIIYCNVILFMKMIFLVQVRLGTEVPRTQVRPNRGLNSWPSDHGLPVHVTDTSALTTRPSLISQWSHMASFYKLWAAVDESQSYQLWQCTQFVEDHITYYCVTEIEWGICNIHSINNAIEQIMITLLPLKLSNVILLKPCTVGMRSIFCV